MEKRRLCSIRRDISQTDQGASVRARKEDHALLPGSERHLTFFRKNLFLLSEWVTKELCFGISVSTQTILCGQWSTTHSQSTSLCIRQPQGSHPTLLRRLFQKTVSDIKNPAINPRRRSMIRLEQKSMVVMQHIFRKLTRPGTMGPDPHIGTEATYKAFSEGGHHRQVTAFDSKRACIEKTTSSLLKTFARQGLKKYSTIIENAKVRKAERLYLHHGTSAQSGFTRNIWETSKRSSALQFFSHHLKQFIPQFYCDMDLHWFT